MKTEHLSINSVIEDYIAKTGNSEVSIDDLLRFSHNALDRIIPAQEFVPKIALMSVRNYKAELPKGFSQVLQASYLDTTSYSPVRAGHVVEYYKNIYGTGSELEGKNCKIVSRVECNGCNDYNPCNTEIITLDVDKEFINAHPGSFYNHSKFYTGERGIGNSHNKTSSMHPHFKLMRKTSNYFYNIPYHINECINVNVDSHVEYDIHLPNIIVNFKEGQILLAYLSRNVDKDGWLMIPNVPIVYDAVIQSIEERLGYIDYRKNKTNENYKFWQDSLMLKEKSIKRARMYLDTMLPDEWEMFIRTHWVRKAPNYLYEAKHNAWDGDKNDPRLTPRY
jgi:hypothetical protein